VIKTVTYDPTIFDVTDLDRARRIILTPLGDQRTDARWETETPYLAELIGSALGLGPESVVIDYGCGIGRISKALIERYGCTVLGVDISAQMRSFAPQYVDASGFSAVSRRVLERMVAKGFRADAAISIWVLQHCRQPADDIHLLRSALGNDSKMVIVNNENRAVPTKEIPWFNDGVDVRELLNSKFAEENSGRLDADVVGELIAANTWWALYRTR
jgi:SAM-dependent methyltransferase